MKRNSKMFKIIKFANDFCRYNELKRQFDLKQSEAELLEGKLKQSSHGQQLDDIETLQKSIGIYFTIFFPTCCIKSYTLGENIVQLV